MAQHDYVIANGTGAAVRSDLNNALAAIVSQNSGATAPATTYAYQFWADTTTNLLKLRNSANSAWITLFQLDGEWSTLPVENGTAAAPSIYFKDSGTDTGFYSPGTDQVGISTAGTSRLTIDANGNLAVDTNSLYVDAANNRVGIGTSSPSYNLQVAETSAVVSAASYSTFFGQGTRADLILRATSSAADQQRQVVRSNSDSLIFGTENSGATAFTEKVRIDSSGRVGIGTTSAGGKLHVSSGSSSALVSADADDLIVENSGNCGITIASPNSGTGSIRFTDPQNNDSGSISYNHNDETLRFATFSTERARFDSSGRWLLGTSTASLSQQIESASTGGNNLGIIRYNNGTGGSEFVLAHSRSNSVGTNTVLSSGDRISDILFRGADGTNYIDAASISAFVDATPGTNDMPGRLVFSTTADGSSSPVEKMRINCFGEILTYTLATGTNIVFSNNNAAGTSYPFIDGKYSATAVGNGTLSFRVWNNGNVQNTNNSYTAISDIKLKENIVDANSQWHDIKSLQVRNYNFKEGQTHKQIGLIAQEVEPISPGLVYESPDRDDDGNDLGTVTKSVNYSVLYMKAVKALQEAMERIEQLETEMAAVKAQLS